MKGRDFRLANETKVTGRQKYVSSCCNGFPRGTRHQLSPWTLSPFVWRWIFRIYIRKCLRAKREFGFHKFRKILSQEKIRKHTHESHTSTRRYLLLVFVFSLPKKNVRPLAALKLGNWLADQPIQWSLHESILSWILFGFLVSKPTALACFSISALKCSMSCELKPGKNEATLVTLNLKMEDKYLYSQWWIESRL